MNGSRTAMLALLALSLSAGCRTAGVSNLARTPQPLPRSSATAQELVAELNRNAERVESFEAAPSITVYSSDGNVGADGRLAFVRPRNFKLQMSLAMQDLADIGSNDDEFWFWTKPRDRREKKAIYYCKYDESGDSPLAGALQPDWIVEALGFRMIPSDEADAITAKPGKAPGTLVLNHPAGVGTGLARSYRRETVLSETTHHVLEHRVYSSTNVLLARATASDRDYTAVPVDAGGQAAKVNIPTKLRLEWFKENQQNLTLDVWLKSPRVNTEWPPDRRAGLFVEPSKKGERINLAELAGVRDDDRTSVRNTRPIPPSGVKLGDPAPLGADETRAAAPRDPIALTADLGTFPGAPTPAAAPDLVQPALIGSEAGLPPPGGRQP